MAFSLATFRKDPPMIFDITTFTLIHVVLSLLGIFAGLVVVGGLVAGRRLDGWTGVFLVTTVLTNVSGFGFPFVTFLPSHGVGIISLVILPIVIAARTGNTSPESGAECTSWERCSRSTSTSSSWSCSCSEGFRP